MSNQKSSLKRHKCQIHIQTHTNHIKSSFKPNNNWIEQTLAGNKLQSNNNGSKERYKITEKKR